ncbi:MAG: YDG domain-containing protein [Clostridiales bacterium]|jgi:hypothetical protein|nr:YDG domain-containing protein [Clostridiales bacterium]
MTARLKICLFSVLCLLCAVGLISPLFGDSAPSYAVNVSGEEAIGGGLSGESESGTWNASGGRTWSNITDSEASNNTFVPHNTSIVDRINAAAPEVYTRWVENSTSTISGNLDSGAGIVYTITFDGNLRTAFANGRIASVSITVTYALHAYCNGDTGTRVYMRRIDGYTDSAPSGANDSRRGEFQALATTQPDTYPATGDNGDDNHKIGTTTATWNMSAESIANLKTNDKAYIKLWAQAKCSGSNKNAQGAATIEQVNIAFTYNTPAVNVTVNPSAGGTLTNASSAATVNAATIVGYPTATVTPNDGYYLNNWSGATTGSLPTLTFPNAFYTYSQNSLSVTANLSAMAFSNDYPTFPYTGGVQGPNVTEPSLITVVHLYTGTTADGDSYSSATKPKNAGTYTYSADFKRGSDVIGTTGDKNFTIEPKSITLIRSPFSDYIVKTYDGTKSVPDGFVLNSTNLGSYVSLQSGSTWGTGDSMSSVISVAPGYEYSDANAGNSGVNSIIITISANGNYSLATTSITLPATISKKGLTVTSAIASDKIYDGYNTAAVTLEFDGYIGFDALGAGDYTVNAIFADYNAGANKTVSVSSYSIGSGSIARNYNIATLISALPAIKAEIFKRELTVLSVTAASKTYDGARTASVTSAAFDGALTGHNFTANLNSYCIVSATFDTADAGTGKTVTATIALRNVSPAFNYVIVGTIPTTAADIGKKDISISSATVRAREYDATTAGTVTTVGFLGTIATISSTYYTAIAEFENAAAANNKNVTVTVVLTGTGDTNYNLLNDTFIAKGNITKRSTAFSVTVKNKIYDGTTAAEIDTVLFTRTLETLVLDVDYTILAVFYDKNVGTGKGASATISLNTTAAAANYSLTAATAESFADIGQATVSSAEITITYGENKPEYALYYINGQEFAYGTADWSDSIYKDVALLDASDTPYSVFLPFTPGIEELNYAYTASAEIIVTVNKKELVITVNSPTVVYDGKNHFEDISAQIDESGITVVLISITSSNGTVYSENNLINAGTYKAVFGLSANTNYTAADKTAVLTITRAAAEFSLTREFGKLTVNNPQGYDARYSIDGGKTWQKESEFDVRFYEKVQVIVELDGDDGVNYTPNTPPESVWIETLYLILAASGMAALIISVVLIIVIVKKRKDKGEEKGDSEA